MNSLNSQDPPTETQTQLTTLPTAASTAYPTPASTPPTPTTPETPSPTKAPPNVDDIIQKFLSRADEYADQEEVEPKVLCALGWLVVKMKAAQTKAAASGQPPSTCVTEETVSEFERSGKIV